jgi:hypothetical protein
MVDPEINIFPDSYFNLGLILVVIGFVSFGIWLWMFLTMDIKIGKYYSEKHILTSKTFEMFQARLEEELYERDFEKVQEFTKKDYYMALYFKKGLDSVYAFALINSEEMTEEIINDSYTDFWEYTEGTSKLVKTKDIHLIHCICVKRINKAFREFLYEEIENYVGRYQLPIGISFGGRGLYIPVQKGTLFPGKYKKLKKLFMSLVEIS